MKTNTWNWSAQTHGVRGEPLFIFGGRWAIVALAATVALAVFTHFFNLVGFPSMGPDEGNLVRQAIQTRATGNVYAPGTPLYGAPFFGWYFLAILFAIAGFPPATMGADIGSFYNFYFVARAIVAALAVVDTLLLYFVGRRLLRGEGYGLVAAAIFAVAPTSVWYFRLPLLQVLMVPWLLLALHFALVARDNSNPLWTIPSALAFAAAVLTWFPSLLFIAAFVLLFGLAVARDRSTTAPLRSLLTWTCLAIVAILAWVVYAATNNLLPYLAGGAGWAPGPVAGLDMGKLLGYLLSLDPLLSVLGFAGIALAVVRRRFVAAALPLLALILLATLSVRWDFHLAVLAPLLAFPAGFLVVGVVQFVLGPLSRTHRPSRLKELPLAPILVIFVVLALILPSASFGMARDQNWTNLSASGYIAREAPPYSVVIANAPYVSALGRARPDLWVVNWWDPGFQVLQNASTDPVARQQTIFLRDNLGNLKYDAPVAGNVPLQLPAGDYVAIGRRSDVSAGQVAFRLDRDVGILFLAYGMDPVVLANPNSPARGSVFTVTLLDPASMTRFLLVDDQLRLDAEKLPFLRHLAGEDGQTVYASNNEESIHQVALPSGVYHVKVWGPGGAFLGSALVKLDADQSIVFNVDSRVPSTQSFEVSVPQDPGQRHALHIMVQHSNGLPLSWAWVEVQQVNGRAFYQNGVNSAEVRVAEGS